VRPPGCCIDCYTEVRDLGPQAVAKRAKRPTEGVIKPRCATHRRMEKKRVRDAGHARRVQAMYGLAAGDYERLFAFQGGKCAICRRARGVKRRLAVDHDHATGLARGLTCSPCNSMLAHSRDDLEFYRRAYHYLANPPAKRAGIIAIAREVRDGSDSIPVLDLPQAGSGDEGDEVPQARHPPV
jgi:hypothetical protein